jgi:hypothetical protein
MRATDFVTGSKPEVCPSEYAGMMCMPLMTCAGSRNVNAYGSLDSTNPIFGSRAWQIPYRYQPGSTPNHRTHRKSIWRKDFSTTLVCKDDTRAWNMPITRAYQNG